MAPKLTAHNTAARPSRRQPDSRRLPFCSLLFIDGISILRPLIEYLRATGVGWITPLKVLYRDGDRTQLLTSLKRTQSASQGRRHKNLLRRRTGPLITGHLNRKTSDGPVSDALLVLRELHAHGSVSKTRIRAKGKSCLNGVIHALTCCGPVCKGNGAVTFAAVGFPAGISRIAVCECIRVSPTLRSSLIGKTHASPGYIHIIGLALGS